MITSIRRLFVAAGLLVFAVGLEAQSVVFDSTGFDFNYYAPLSGIATKQAQHFTTDNSSDLTLIGISFRIDYVIPGGQAVNDPTVTIRADTGDDPDAGAVLASFTNSSGPITNGYVYADFSGSVTLAANTAYWVVLEWNGPSGHEFGITTVDNGGGAGAGTWLTTADQTFSSYWSGWSPTPGTMLNMTMTVASSAIPEPSTYAAMLGLGAMLVVVWRRRLRTA